MFSLLQQLDIFELRPLITNLSCKLSTVSDYDARKQLLCLVSEENDIVLRYTSEGGQEVLKLISWFRRTNRVIHDVCFDPSGTWLLVLCFDNTLHIVPALAVVDKTFLEPKNSTQPPQQPYSTTQVTSYIIPFVGPHECPNSKKCPNHNPSSNSKNNNSNHSDVAPAAAPSTQEQHEANKQHEKDVQSLSEALEKIKVDKNATEESETLAKEALKEDDATTAAAGSTATTSTTTAIAANLEAFSHDMPAHMLAPATAAPAAHLQNEDKTGNNQVMTTSFMASNTCPYPLSVVWWQTLDGVNRAIIGYSDGSICFVGLSPNCPFVASTTIESGSVVKLLICKDNTFESVMLLITSSLKQQFKLLLEQKAIKYIYPGDISPTTAQARESDWQIIMPIKANSSNCSDPASDSSQLDEDVFVRTDELPTSSTAAAAAAPSTAAPTTAPATVTKSHNNNSNMNMAQPMGVHGYICTSQLPPPPPYSVAISRHLDNAPTTTSAGLATATAVSSSGGGGVRFSQQQLPDLDNFYERAGIFPAARARLASLKSLGSKKLNAIKMRLSDNRQKLEEYIPENTLGSFAIMDSPSLTPEILSHSIGSFYTIQNLRSTYLLSALHSQSNSLTVHSIDINLKPLFLYKIPKHCFDILISSNTLYSIQYVDIRSCYEQQLQQQPQQPQQQQQQELQESQQSALPVNKEPNTEKENRDTDVEKQEKYAAVKQLENIDLSDDDDKLMQDAGGSSSTESADTSATSSGASSSNDSMTPTNSINAVGVISSAMASMRTGDDDRFNIAAQLALFRFEHETILSLYQMATYRTLEPNEIISKEEKAKAFDYKDIRSPIDYVQFYETADVKEEYSLRQMEIMQNEFPKINYDPCYVVTNKNVYYIQLKKEPFAIFLDAALAGEWQQCREFCNTFDLSYEVCIEFAGDYLLRRKKVTQALFTYNTARIKPIRTALKLAMFGQTTALMHLCAMALKTTYILKSHYFCHPIIKSLMPDITYRHSEDVRTILPSSAATAYGSGKQIVNEGAACSDYVYGVDESISNLQMSPSSQFHLANLLLITLAEKAVNDKNYLPLWNFLVTNAKYHTNMTSIVLCQSGLFSAALILAKTRGVCIDTFLALTSVVSQEFGWYTELNVCLYNLSESIFCETITYLPHVAVDYFGFIQDKIEPIRQCVLKRLEQQLNPFSAVLRPIVSHTSSGHMEHNLNDNNTYLFEFCKNLIETYLAVLIHMESQRSKHEHIVNALSTFRITYEDNQFAIETSRFKPISAGCAHCACVVDGIAYFWGSNGVPCNYSVNKSSDPPEPPHAVKSLELISHLNLEVHAVKCGRQHTLVLTNNGLYAFGNNNLSQLGIGKHMQVSLQPMLVKAFDGKNVTIIEAGQYHNAAVADGLLYTWGWGIYGQLGHGNTENVAAPKVVTFFKYKKVLQVSLGHAHSLVLCQGPSNSTTDLYVFGSNHFGQLGLGAATTAGANDAGSSSSSSPAQDDLNCASQVKSLLPLRLDVSTARIRLIHTKFFTNLAVDENERMYTWGSSPQALRLANQIKRRANAKQKNEEHQRREMSKRFEATLTNMAVANEFAPPTVPLTPDTVAQPTAVTLRQLSKKLAASEFVATITNQVRAESANDIVVETNKITEELNSTESSASDTANCKPPAVLSDTNAEVATSTTAANINVTVADDVDAVQPATMSKEVVQTTAGIKIEIIEDVVEEMVETVKPMQALPLKAKSDINMDAGPPVVVMDGRKRSNVDAVHSSATQALAAAAAALAAQPEVDPCEHMAPTLVDTTEVAGQILQISSGLFHFALISSSCTLYTWGKNLEHQLGTEDKERRAVHKPSPIDSIERPMYVDCGADFTLVMTTDFVVKAFGGNSNGQCGRDLGPSIEKMKQRVVCLPATKRLMRFESQCVEAPVEINLPRPRIRLDNEPVRYLKCIPQYQAHFVQEAAINFDDKHFERPSPSHQYKSTTQADSSENIVTGQDSDDMISSLENFSNNDGSSLNFIPENGLNQGGCSCDDVTPEEQSYALLPGTDNADHSALDTVQLSTNAPQNQANNTNALTAPTGIVPAELNNETQSTITCDADEPELQELRHYIHYCLYVFHGLYNPDKVRDFSKERLEYRIRTLMLNFKFIDAFVLCLQDCGTAHKTLKIFEYFTKDTGFVPMRRQDLKFLIYHLLMHFLVRKFDMLECERFFLGDLDYYLLELAYVLYFNNNNTVLEQNLNQKFKNLIAQEDDAINQNQQHHQQQQNQQQQQTHAQHKLEDTDVIFDSLSVKFKTIVCQRLIKHCSCSN